jgi:2-iminobutanoate/2-iminopropanoate deaminase
VRELHTQQQEDEPVTKRIIRTDKAPAPIGPYSQGIVAAGLVFTAGQGGIDPQTKKLVPGGVAAETRQTLENLKSILAAAGCTMADVVSVNVYLVDMADFPAMNQVYGEYFSESPPARTTVAVAQLPMGSMVEITCAAVKPG